ncbi:MAG: UDP-glucose/GDP-mannose dehydrogenase family protein [Chloroflexi bacterium]|nr:MAG: UDP-glucose 6-dehydrogenase [Phototrophicales bacterium]RMF80013.1 MAG: UDP-glucose/GDP-mannose dehydrogenase family protein [Chloroflexota bacterium]
MKNICVIGTGYVGLVTGTCFADLGNRVIAVDYDEAKVERLKQGEMPIYEPGLKEMVERNTHAGRLSFTTSYDEGLEDAEYVFICVGTPEGVDGEADLQYVRSAAESIAKTMKHPLIIINKSTVPVGTGDWVADIVRNTQPSPIAFSVVSCPEFLREGSAVRDFMNPDRTVLGSTDKSAAEAVAQLYLSLRAPIVMTDLRTAEMIKYASNAFLATRISFINEISIICEKLGADVMEVAQGMGFDQRIGHHFLQAGVGYGGSCFPKDVKALAYMADTHGMHPQLLRAVMDINSFQRKHIMLKVQDMVGDLENKVIALLGLAFKENTDDIRESPALTVAEYLLNEGAIVRAYDPVAMPNTTRVMPKIDMCNNPYDLAKGADALVVLTPWNEFKQLDMGKICQSMKQPILVDGRNMYEPAVMREIGFAYRGVGRGYDGVGHTTVEI